LQSEVKHKMQRRITFTTEELLKRYWWKKDWQGDKIYRSPAQIKQKI
jgi:hypothetical protein